MNWLESVRIAARALRANTLRSALTALGFVVGVGAVVCTAAIGAGAEADVSEKIRTLGANLLLVIPGAQTSGGARLASGTRPTLTEADADAIRRDIAEVQVSAPLLSHPMPLVAGDRNWTSVVAGINGDYMVAREWRVATGRSFTLGESEGASKVAIIGSVIVDELFDGRMALGGTLRIGAVPFTVVGVLDKKGLGTAGLSQDDVVFIPLATAQSHVLGAVRGVNRSALDLIAVKIGDATAVADATNGIATLLRQRHRIRRDSPDDFRIENPADVLAARWATARTLGALLIAVASVSLVVGGVSVMNIMLVSVTERTREIGLRMAVGASRRDIGTQFLIEALVLAIAGGLIGALLGSAAAMAIAWNAGWPVVISPWSILGGCGFAGLIGTVFGLYPAQRAARMDPIAALRSE